LDQKDTLRRILRRNVLGYGILLVKIKGRQVMLSMLLSVLWCPWSSHRSNKHIYSFICILCTMCSGNVGYDLLHRPLCSHSYNLVHNFVVPGWYQIWYYVPLYWSYLTI